MSAAGSDRSAEIAQLIDRHHRALAGDVHKDGDCHWAITERFSYGRHAGWVVEHDGYRYDRLKDGEDGPLPTREEAEVVLIEHLLAAVAELEDSDGSPARRSAAISEAADPRRALGEAVRLRRMEEDVDLSQQALADRAGITVAHLSNLEKGCGDPTWETTRSLAAALGLSFRELLVRTERLIEAEADERRGRRPPTT